MTNEIEIVRAEISDLDAVEALYDEVCDYLADKPYNPGWRKGCFPARENALYFIENQAMYVAKTNGEIVGSVSLTYNPSADVDQQSGDREAEQRDILYLHIFAVHPNRHRSGIGSKLLEFADAYAGRAHAKCLRLYVWEHNSVAIRAYEKNGYRRIGRADIGLGEFGLDWFYLYERRVGDKTTCIPSVDRL